MANARGSTPRTGFSLTTTSAQPPRRLAVSRPAMPILLAPGAIARMQFTGVSCDDLSVVAVYFRPPCRARCVCRSLWPRVATSAPNFGIDRFVPTALVGLPHLCRPQPHRFAKLPSRPMPQRHASHIITEYLARLCASVADGNPSTSAFTHYAVNARYH